VLLIVTFFCVFLFMLIFFKFLIMAFFCASLFVMIFFVCLLVTLFVCPIHDDFFRIFIRNDHMCIPRYDPL